MPKPTFSILFCVNRSNRWLKEAVESVLDQSDSDFEFLIAANACDDELWEHLVKLTCADERVRLFRTDIGQLAFNLNYLANHAMGSYLVRMDADDVSEINRIQVLRSVLLKGECDVLGSAVTLIDEDGISKGIVRYPSSAAAIQRAMTYKTVFCHPSVVIRREFLFKMRGYLGGFASEDTDLWLRSCIAGAKMRNLQEPLLRYRIHSEQSIRSANGYSEVVGIWAKEFFKKPSFYLFIGLFVSLCKRLKYFISSMVRN